MSKARRHDANDEVRELTSTTEAYLRGSSCQLTIEQRIAREIGLRQRLEETDREDPNPLVRQRTDPDHPNRIILEVVED
jgi:hypothetical protein